QWSSSQPPRDLGRSAHPHETSPSRGARRAQCSLRRRIRRSRRSPDTKMERRRRCVRSGRGWRQPPSRGRGKRTPKAQRPCGPGGTRAGAAAAPGLPLGLPTYLAALQARFGVTPAMVKGAGWSIGGTASGAVASFVVQIILARALEATRYGVYSYLLAWVNVA